MLLYLFIIYFQCLYKLSSFGNIFPKLDFLLSYTYIEVVEMIIDRPKYLEELKNWKDKDLIKVVTGIRRCGKSYII